MNKKVISMLALGLLLGGGAVGAYQVAAQNNNAINTPVVTQGQELQNVTNGNNAALNENENDNEMNDEAENQALAGQASISADQAKQAAEAQVGGTASSVQLDSENGLLVYEVKIGNQEVKVDAGDGSVLKVEKGDNGQDKTENDMNNSNDVEETD